MRASYSEKYIIVLGANYSGSGAVLDYLNGRGVIYDPLRGAEYLPPQAPGGLMALEAMRSLFVVADQPSSIQIPDLYQCDEQIVALDLIPSY